MDSTKYNVVIEFTSTVLGSQPALDTVIEYINPALPEDEAAALPEKIENQTTVFHKVDGKPVLFDYQVLGCVKNAAMVVNQLKTYEKIRALKSKVENTVFVFPRIIPLILPEGTEMTYCSRPIAAWTPQGPRTFVARSEELPIGTKAKFWFEVLEGSQIDKDILSNLLEYGGYHGIGQWRNGSHGRFTFVWE